MVAGRPRPSRARCCQPGGCGHPHRARGHGAAGPGGAGHRSLASGAGGACRPCCRRSSCAAPRWWPRPRPASAPRRRLTPAGLVPKPYALRLFVAATDGGFAVLPGGLAMTVDPDRTVALSAPDGESRDVWIVGEAPSAPFTSLWRPTVEAARIRRPVEELPSRAAENLFWLGRYAERADWSMRVLRTCLGRLQEDSPARQYLPACRAALEGLLSAEDGELPGHRERTSAALIEQLARSLMTSAEEPLGLPRLLDNVHRVAGVTRDRLSSEAWRALNEFHAGRRWRAGAMPPGRGDALRLLDEGLRALAAFNGLTARELHARLRLVVPRPRPAARARRQPGGAAARHLRARRRRRGRVRQPALRAGGGRQLHHLPLALPAGADAAAAARPAAGRREQPARLAFQLVRIEEHIDRLPQSGPPSGAGGGRLEEQRLVLCAADGRAPGRRGVAHQGRARTARAPACRGCSTSSPRPWPLSRMRSGGATSIWSRRASSGCVQVRAGRHDLRCQPPHDLRLRPAGAAVRAPRPHDAALGCAPDRAPSQPADRAGAVRE